MRDRRFFYACDIFAAFSRQAPRDHQGLVETSTREGFYLSHNIECKVGPDLKMSVAGTY
jgi:hypothetical protein